MTRFFPLFVWVHQLTFPCILAIYQVPQLFQGLFSFSQVFLQNTSWHIFHIGASILICRIFHLAYSEQFYECRWRNSKLSSPFTSSRSSHHILALEDHRFLFGGGWRHLKDHPWLFIASQKPIQAPITAPSNSQSAVLWALKKPSFLESYGWVLT